MPRPKPRRKPTPELDALLLTAVAQTNVELARTLLTAGADPNTRDAKGNPVLWHALLPGCVGFVVSDGEIDMMTTLLEAGADPELDEVALRMCRSAAGAVCAALELHDAQRVAATLGVPWDAI